MFKAIALFALLALAVVFGPLLSIWALNVLFPVLAIPYTLKTWFAVIVVGVLVRGANHNKKS